MKRIEEKTIPQVTMKRVVQVMVRLFEERATVDHLASDFHVHKRTVYRYLDLLESVGVQIEKDFEGNFFIASDQCPCCKGLRG